MIPWTQVESQGHIQSKRNENSSYRLKTPKAEHGRRSERNKYPSERRDTWEDEPSGEHLCLTFTNNLKLNRGRRLRNDVSFFFAWIPMETRLV